MEVDATSEVVTVEAMPMSKPTMCRAVFSLEFRLGLNKAYVPPSGGVEGHTGGGRGLDLRPAV